MAGAVLICLVTPSLYPEGLHSSHPYSRSARGRIQGSRRLNPAAIYGPFVASRLLPPRMTDCRMPSTAFRPLHLEESQGFRMQS